MRYRPRVCVLKSVIVGAIQNHRHALPEHPNDAVLVQQWVALSGLGANECGQLNLAW